MNDTANELKKIEEAEAALAEQRKEIERKEREWRYKREPRLRIERHYTGVGHHQNHRPRDYKISDDFKKPIEYLKEIADAHAANVQSMDEDEKYIADTGLEDAYGVSVRRKTRRGRLSVGYEFILSDWLPEDQMKQVVDLLNSFKDE